MKEICSKRLTIVQGFWPQSEKFDSGGKDVIRKRITRGAE